MILVTGGSGLVGAEVIFQLLQRNEKVTAIFHNSLLPDFNNENLSVLKCDILDTFALEEVMHGIQQVYHCAAVVAYDPKNKNNLYNVNVKGTANVVNAAIAAGVQKMVHVSSVSALGRMRNNETVNEEMNWTEKTNNSEYGKSKYFAEMEVWRGTGEGLNAIIVNPSTILGPGNWNSSSSKIFKTAYEEFPWYSEGISGFVDVKDVAKIMILLMNSEITNERFILNAGHTSFKNVFCEIAKCFGKRPPHKRVTPLIGKIVWRWDALKSLFTGNSPLVTKETTRIALASVHFDNSKVLKALPGFQFTPLNESIKNTCATLKQKYHL
jgi:nucleoside-diphosphate-sugar epimerase